MQQGSSVLKQKVLGYVGLAAKAGALLKGADSVLDGIMRGRVVLVLVARDAGGIADVVARSCRENAVPMLSVVDKTDLGWQLGRQSYAVVGLTSLELAQAIIKTVDQGQTAEKSGGVS